MDDPGIRKVLIEASRVNLSTLIIDLDVAPPDPLLQSLHTYRVLRPNTRVIALARNRHPPDETVSELVVGLGVYDIVTETEEKLISALEQTLNSSPATYDQAAKWVLEIEEEKKEKKIWWKGLTKKEEKEKNTNNFGPQPDPTPLQPEINKQKSPLPEDFYLIDSDEKLKQALKFFDQDNYTAIIIPSEFTGLAEKIKNIRRSFCLMAIPIVVLGKSGFNQNNCPEADEVIEVLTTEAIERIRHRAAQNKELWRKAAQDILTGAYNRQFAEDYLDKLIQNSHRTGFKFSVAILDLDKFKNINDTYGHNTGDGVLKEFSSFIASHKRSTDVYCRWGGEEFVIFYPCCKLPEAVTVTERICREWANHKIVYQDLILNSTFSAGVAEYNSGDIIVEADRALYNAKANGRNCVETPLSLNAPLKPKNTKPEFKPVELTKKIQNIFQSVKMLKPGLDSTKVTPYGKNKSFLGTPYVSLNSQVITFCSPWTPEINLASPIIAVARRLAKKNISVAVIDADFKKPEIGPRLDMPIDELWRYDWRREPVALRIDKNIFIFVLDPVPQTFDSREISLALDKTLNYIQKFGGISKVLINAGDDPELDVLGDKLLLVDENEISHVVIEMWEFKQPFKNGGVLINGNHYLAEKFGLPFLGTYNPNNINATAKTISTILTSASV